MIQEKKTSVIDFISAINVRNRILRKISIGPALILTLIYNCLISITYQKKRESLKHYPSCIHRPMYDCAYNGFKHTSIFIFQMLTLNIKSVIDIPTQKIN